MDENLLKFDFSSSIIHCTIKHIMTAKYRVTHKITLLQARICLSIGVVCDFESYISFSKKTKNIKFSQTCTNTKLIVLHGVVFQTQAYLFSKISIFLLPFQTHVKNSPILARA